MCVICVELYVERSLLRTLLPYKYRTAPVPLPPINGESQLRDSLV